MRLLIHFLVSLIFMLIFIPIFGYLAFAFFIGGFLIDVDHYLWYFIKKRKLNLKEAYYYHRDKEYFTKEESKSDLPLLHIFHVFEIWLIVFILAFFHKFFLIIFLGLLVHVIMDITEMVRTKAYKIRAISLFYWILKQFKG